MSKSKLTNAQRNVIREMRVNGTLLFYNFSQGGWCLGENRIHNNTGDSLNFNGLIKRVLKCSVFSRYELTDIGKSIEL